MLSENGTPAPGSNRPYLKPIEWCRCLVKAGYATAGVIILAHVVWYFTAFRYLAVPPRVYVWEFIVFPFIGLLLLNGAADLFIRWRRPPLIAKEYVSLLLFLVFSFYLCLTHRIASVLLGSFALSVFASTIFSNVKITRRIFGIGSAALLFLCAKNFLERNSGSSALMELFVAWDILLCSYLLCRVLIRYGQENTVALMSSYHLQQHMREELKLDPFTGLYNKKTFSEVLPEWIGLCRAREKSLTLAMIDIDHFKRINDVYGHAAGDRALLHLARILKSRASESTGVFRIGGEEFAVLFQGRGAGESVQICDAMRAAMESSALREDSMHITFSCGLACLGPRNPGPAELSRAADSALYRAKNGGRNRVVADAPPRGAASDVS